MSFKDRYLCYISSGVLEIVYDLRIKKFERITIVNVNINASLLSTHHYYQRITIINASLLSTHHYYQRITIINASLLSTHHYYQHITIINISASLLRISASYHGRGL
jgi:hypothetical protein